MAKSLPVSASISFILPLRNTIVKAISLCAAAASSVLEIFDGGIDSAATVTAGAGGTGYVVGDILTLVAGETGSADSRAQVLVTQVDHNSPSSSVSSSASSSVSSSTSSSVSPSSSASPSHSVSSSPSPSLSASSSVSHSPSASLSASSSISSSPSSSVSHSVSSSPSSSISSSASASPSPSGAGPGAITAVSIRYSGGGYVAGNLYAVTGGSGTDATVRINSITDAGTSIGKIACVANESAPPLELCVLTTNGVSLRISGTGAKGHFIYE